MNVSLQLKDAKVTLGIDNMVRVIAHFKEPKKITQQQVLTFLQKNPPHEQIRN